MSDNTSAVYWYQKSINMLGVGFRSVLAGVAFALIGLYLSPLAIIKTTREKLRK